MFHEFNFPVHEYFALKKFSILLQCFKNNFDLSVSVQIFPKTIGPGCSDSLRPNLKTPNFVKNTSIYYNFKV